VTTAQELYPCIPAVEALTHITDQDVLDYARLLPQLSPTENTLEEIADNLNRLVVSDHSKTMVIRDQDGRIQATASASFYPLPIGIRAWIDNVVVDVHSRGRGYARQLTEALHDWLQAQGATSVNLTSGPSRKTAGEIYMGMGYVERETRVFRKELVSHVGASALIPKQT